MERLEKWNKNVSIALVFPGKKARLVEYNDFKGRNITVIMR